MEAARHIMRVNRLCPPFPRSSAALQPVFGSCLSAHFFPAIYFGGLMRINGTDQAHIAPLLRVENSGKLRAGKNASGPGDLPEF